MKILIMLGKIRLMQEIQRAFDDESLCHGTRLQFRHCDPETSFGLKSVTLPYPEVSASLKYLYTNKSFCCKYFSTGRYVYKLSIGRDFPISFASRFNITHRPKSSITSLVSLCYSDKRCKFLLQLKDSPMMLSLSSTVASELFVNHTIGAYNKTTTDLRLQEVKKFLVAFYYVSNGFKASCEYINGAKQEIHMHLRKNYDENCCVSQDIRYDIDKSVPFIQMAVAVGVGERKIKGKVNSRGQITCEVEGAVGEMAKAAAGVILDTNCSSRKSLGVSWGGRIDFYI